MVDFIPQPSPQGEGGPRTVDEVNPNANYNSHLAKRYSIGHLIRRLRRHRLAAARSHFGSGIINAIHYRNAASLPLRGRQ